MEKQRIAIILVLIISVFGMLPSLYLTNVHYDLENTDSTETVCDIVDLGEGFDCDIVNQSPWSEIMGIPIAFLGFLFYFFVALVAIGVLLGWTFAPRLLYLVHLLTIFSIFYSGYLFYIAKFVLNALCIFCMIMYAVNVGLLVSSKIATGKAYKDILRGLLP
jgi:uncharacterized membrane protein